MRSQHRAGFTLIELMVAMALTMFVMVILSLEELCTIKPARIDRGPARPCLATTNAGKIRLARVPCRATTCDTPTRYRCAVGVISLAAVAGDPIPSQGGYSSQETSNGKVRNPNR